MKYIAEDQTVGKIEYNESFWTGKKSLSINDVPLTKVEKNVFAYESGERVTLSGNSMSGVKLEDKGMTVQIVPSVKWYEIVLSILPFLLIVIWGNSAYLRQIVPVVGGAIGGGVSAVLSGVNLFVVKNIKKVWLKILVSVGILAATFLVCYLLALLVLAVINQLA